MNGHLLGGMLFLVLLLAEWFGFRFGGRRARLDASAQAPFNVLQNAIYGLLALLLAFSFSLGLARYDARRTTTVQEANAIGTTILRTRLLSSQSAQRMRTYLRAYVDARIAFAADPANHAGHSEAAARSSVLQRQMWVLATDDVRKHPESIAPLLFIQTLNETIDRSGDQAAVLVAHIPDEVLLVLSALTVVSAVLLGASFGIAHQRAVVPLGIFAIILAVVVTMVVDLDQPQYGFIRVSLDPLRALQSLLH